ncbi:endonuclease domain-containing protein [Phenylobacterium sp.]|uniref:endonuclease domain-containing protein n=1 Tax=Phenylobacterium sp. TaxID=1871053 RepID=UPI00393CCBA3
MADRTATRIASRARALRKAMTGPEVLLWTRLNGRGEDKPVFRRQFACGAMIFDFYCPMAKLAVEIDGATHWSDDRQARDEGRDHWLASRGIAVLRIGAGEVYRNLDGVADAVILAVEARIRGGARGACGFPFPPLALRRAVPPSREREGITLSTQLQHGDLAGVGLGLAAVAAGQGEADGDGQGGYGEQGFERHGSMRLQAQATRSSDAGSHGRA